MAKVRTSASLRDPAQAQLRDQLLTIFRDSRQLKENSAQLRQRLVGAVFGTVQQQIDTARSERFEASQASKKRKGDLIQTGVKATIPVVGGALTGGIAGGITGGAQGAGLGALAGASAGFGLPTSRAGSPASMLFDTNVAGPSLLNRAVGGTAQKAITPLAVPGPLTSVAGPSTGTQLVTPTFPEDFAPAGSPAGGVEKATNAIAQIAGLGNRELIQVGRDALSAGDQEALELIAAELKRRGF